MLMKSQNKLIQVDEVKMREATSFCNNHKFEEHKWGLSINE